MSVQRHVFGQNDVNATKMAKYTYMLNEISLLRHIFSDGKQF